MSCPVGHSQLPSHPVITQGARGQGGHDPQVQMTVAQLNEEAEKGGLLCRLGRVVPASKAS